MARPLEGKLAIVTGASRGIGPGIAANLAAKGCNLVLGYASPKSRAPAEELTRTLSSAHGIHILLVQADLGTVEGPGQLVEAARKDHSSSSSGSPFQIDIIIHNAGVALNDLLPAIDVADFDASYYVNVRGPLLLTKAAEPFLPRDRSGRIVCVSSTSASLGFPTQSVYGGTKAALEAMARTWARELSERCTVNCINPGPVGTEMWANNPAEFMVMIEPFIKSTPLMRARDGIDPPDVVEDAKRIGGRPGTIEEVAGIVGMLCGAESGWCTGQVVSANGGMILGRQ